MKYAILVLLLSSCAAQSGQFVDRGLFSDTPFVEGEGNSPELASKNARAAIPAEFEEDKNWSRWGGCAKSGEYESYDPATREFSHCASGRYRAGFSLLPRDPERRKQLEAYRAEQRAGRTQIFGRGRSISAAKRDLLAKLPKNSVVEGYSVGCVSRRIYDPVNKAWNCDSSIPGNVSEVSVFVLKPNADTAIQ
ncbi:MAG: hypothetical protein ACXVB9_18190 [Bdellovibrionota bacterium]